MNDASDANKGWLKRIITALGDRLVTLAVTAALAVFGVVLLLLWEGVSDGRVVKALGGVTQVAYNSVEGRVTELEDQIASGEQINRTVADWLANPDRPPIDRRLALFEDDVNAVQGRVFSAPQLCNDIERKIQFCIGPVKCPMITGVHNETDERYKVQATQAPDWLVGAAWTFAGGEAHKAKTPLPEPGTLSIELNAGRPGALVAIYHLPGDATSAQVQFRLRVVYVDQDFSGAGVPCRRN